MPKLALTLVLGLFAASVGVAQQPTPALALKNDAKLGLFLTGDAERTLYSYMKDTEGVSTCYDACATNWPPLLADALPQLPAGVGGELSLVARKDGAKQVAYNGRPLYYWRRDAKAGDTLGQGLGEAWFVAAPQPTVNVTTHDTLGALLTGPQGLTLYAFNKDAAGVSNCYDACATNWPPLLVSHLPSAAADLSGKLGTITRKDGALQVTYNDMPLYYWRRDAKVGDTLGQGLGDAWHVVKP